jgi:CheY-like chemotaxis protein
MNTETLKRMFEPFFTTKPVGEGTGLGLSAVLGIMQNHDGLVTVYSEQGKGTTFYLFFPVVSAIADELASNANSYRRGTGERILFVDDEAVIVNLGRAMLRKSGYAPTVFHSAEEALDAFRSNPNDFDAVVTDLTMPGMTGLMLAKELRRVRSDIPVVLATGYSGSGDAKRAQEAGICQVLAKPFSLQGLTKALHLALVSEHDNRPKQ